jgi:hypothetical protein
MARKLVGQKINDGYYKKLRTGQAVIRTRRCKNCRFEWITAEIPLYQAWRGHKADCCPEHNRTLSEVRKYINKDGAFANPGCLVSGVVNAISMGGIYRRRRCRKLDCKTEDGKRTMWSTAEVLADGRIVEDISICPRCNGKSRALRRRSAK